MQRSSDPDYPRDFLRALDQHQLYTAIRKLAFSSLTHPDPHVRALASMMAQLTTELRPERLFHEIGLIGLGGHRTVARAVAMRWRDTMLRRIYKNLLAEMDAPDAARLIIQRHLVYTRKRLKNDLRRGFCDGDTFEQFFFQMARLGIDLPEDQYRIARIFKHFDLRPKGPLDANEITPHENP